MCVLVHVRPLYPISSSFPPAAGLQGCIRDNYSTIDCHGGAITAFPVTVSGFKLHHAGDPLNSAPKKLQSALIPLFCILCHWRRVNRNLICAWTIPFPSLPGGLLRILRIRRALPEKQISVGCELYKVKR